MDALAKGNRIRRARADAKCRWREIPEPDAIREMAVLVARPGQAMLTWRVEKVLRQAHGVGPVAVRRVLQRAEISDRKTLGGLSDRQRETVVAWLLARAMTRERAAGKDLAA